MSLGGLWLLLRAKENEPVVVQSLFPAILVEGPAVDEGVRRGERSQ